MSSNDFEKIASELVMHFCPQCKSSFGCEHDEDGGCDCVGQEYADNWRKPWCPHCYDLRRSELDCNCNCKWTGGWCHSERCPKYDPDQADPEKMVDYVKGLIMRDLSGFIGKPINEEEIVRTIKIPALKYIEISFTVETCLTSTEPTKTSE